MSRISWVSGSDLLAALAKAGFTGVPLLIAAGKEYGSGSSRDWAAKGVALLGVRAVTPDGSEKEFPVDLRVDTPQEVEYYRSGGILPYVPRQLAS